MQLKKKLKNTTSTVFFAMDLEWRNLRSASDARRSVGGLVVLLVIFKFFDEAVDLFLMAFLLFIGL